MAISRAGFWSFITELVTRNPNLRVPALEEGLFAKPSIFDYLYYIFLFGKGKGRGKGKGKTEKAREKGREKEREKEREKGREGKKGRELRR